MRPSEVKLGILIIFNPLGQKCRVVDFDVKKRNQGTLKSVTTKFLGKKTVLRINACSLSEGIEE